MAGYQGTRAETCQVRWRTAIEQRHRLNVGGGVDIKMSNGDYRQKHCVHHGCNSDVDGLLGVLSIAPGPGQVSITFWWDA